MKKIKYLLLVALLAIITTGCVKFNAHMEIRKDKSMDFSIIYAFDKSLMGEGNGLKEEDFEEVKKDGFDVEKYTEGNYEGFKLTKKIANIDEVSSENDVIYDMSGMMESKEDNKYIFKVVKGSDKNTYIAKIKFDSNDSSMNDDSETSTDELETNETVETTEESVTTTDENTVGDEDETITTTTTSDDSMDKLTQQLMSSMDLSFSVNLPYGATSTNATTKENDNKKLTWKLTSSGEQMIEFTFELKNNDGSDSNMLLYIGIGAAALIVILVVVLLLTKKKNNGPKVEAPVNTPVEPEVKE